MTISIRRLATRPVAVRPPRRTSGLRARLTEVVAPQLSITGSRLTWTRVSATPRYVLMTITGSRSSTRRVSGESYVLAGPVAGQRFMIRTDRRNSAWSNTVTYPAPAPPPATPTPPIVTTPPPTTPPPATTTPTVPTTPTTPEPPPPTATVPTTSTTFPVPSPPPPPPPAPSTTTPVVGLVAGSAISWELGFSRPLGARNVRMEFDISTPVSEMSPILAQYFGAGIRPLLLAGFHGRRPTTAEAKNLATWAAAFGPGGSERRGKGWAESTAVTVIEFGNESSHRSQYPELATDPNWASSAAYSDIARNYALRLRETHDAVTTANPGVGVIAVADSYPVSAAWMNAMFAAAPDLASHVDGWTIHAYGPSWRASADLSLGAAAANGAPDSLPVYVTEVGVASAGGRCMAENSGWDPCITYAGAATALDSMLAGLRSHYPTRLGGLFIYSTRDLSPTGASTDKERYFGSVASDGADKGAFTARVRDELAKTP